MDSHGSAPVMRAPTGAITKRRSADVTRCRRTEVSRPFGVALYSWTVFSTGQRGSCGVTNDPLRATFHLVTALLNTPIGTTGLILPARINSAQPLRYVTTVPIIRARRLANGAIRLAGGA